MGKTITQMREAISRCYDGLSWKDRCSKMKPAQVWAIYHRFIKDGILDKQGRPTRFQEQLNKAKPIRGWRDKAGIIDTVEFNYDIPTELLSEQTPTGEQMTIFDFMKK